MPTALRLRNVAVGSVLLSCCVFIYLFFFGGGCFLSACFGRKNAGFNSVIRLCSSVNSSLYVYRYLSVGCMLNLIIILHGLDCLV